MSTWYSIRGEIWITVFTEWCVVCNTSEIVKIPKYLWLIIESELSFLPPIRILNSKCVKPTWYYPVRELMVVFD